VLVKMACQHGKNLRFTNNENANEFVKPQFRKGWELNDISV